MSSIFGGSYPPGCNSVPDDERKGCGVCGDKKYLISRRDDGRLAVERCDTCQDPATFSDEQAAILAQADGVKCSSVYPCVLLAQTRQRGH